MKQNCFKFISFLFLWLFLVACGSPNEEIDSVEESLENSSLEKLEVFTTIFPLEDFTRKIGGDHVNVTNIVPTGADAHSFEPTARTMISIAEGDAFIYNGAGFEGFTDAVVNSLSDTDVAILKATKDINLISAVHDDEHEEHGLEDEHGLEEEHGIHGDEDEHGLEEDHGTHEDEHDEASEGDEHIHSDEDPHVWLDPILSIKLAENIKDLLVELKPDEKEEFESNFLILKEELEDLDNEFRTMVDQVTSDTFIVSHAGYGYWEARYGLNQIGISGLSPSNEPSQKQIEEIIEYATTHNINYVLFEQSFTSKVAQVIKDEVGAETLILHNLEAATDEDIANGDDYFSLMRQNIETLRQALN